MQMFSKMMPICQEPQVGFQVSFEVRERAGFSYREWETVPG